MTFLENTAKKHLAAAALFATVSVLVLTPVVSFAQERAATSTNSATSSATTTAQSDQASDQVYKFEPLTTLPGLSDISEASDDPSAGLSGFFNTLYRLCIGAAAIIAVIQIMRAGFKIITNKGSFSQNEEAKSLIGNTVLGILLVLSPVIVFSIINPRILNLEFDFSDLSSTRPNPIDSSASNPTQQRMCQQYERTQAVNFQGTNVQECQLLEGRGNGWVETDGACCAGITTGSICCGYDREADQRQRPQVPVAPENTNGSFYIEYANEERNFATANGKCVLANTARYQTRDACIAALRTVTRSTPCGNQTCLKSVRHNCSVNGEVMYFPDQRTYNSINSLEACQQ